MGMDNNNKRTFDYLPLSIRLETLGKIATPLILRGTPLPATRSEFFSTASDNQPSVEIRILIGESSLSRNNTVVGVFHLKNIPAAKRGEPKIKIEFSVEPTCEVIARATIQGTTFIEKQAFQAPDLTEEFLKKTLSDADANRESDELEVSRQEIRQKATGLLDEAEKRLAAGPNNALSEAIAALGLAMSSGIDDEIKRRSENLSSLLASNIFSSGSDFRDIFSAYFNPSQTKPTSNKKPAPPRKQEELVPSQPKHSLGKIFGGGAFTLDSQLCFVLMPFDAKFQPIYEDHIRPTIQGTGLRCERADEIKGINHITIDIWERINRCRFLIAELTDQNPNVFYELGLAHALGKDVIIITQSMNFVPFDIKSLRCIVYDVTARGTKKLEADLRATIDAVMKSS